MARSGGCVHARFRVRRVRPRVYVCRAPQSCAIEKAFLFDVVSKIYLATDSGPVDVQSFELCSDMIDVVIDVSCIYGMKGGGEGYAYDSESASEIRLTGGVYDGMVLYLREVGK